MVIKATVSTRSNSHDKTKRGSRRRVSSAHSDLYTDYNRTERSPPIGPAQLPSRPSHPSKSTSPADHTRSGFNSPRIADYCSPLSASLRLAILQKENSFERIYGAMATDARGQSGASLPYSSSYGHPPFYPPSTTPPSYSSHCQTSIDIPSRRPTREMNRPPPLTHEDTTLSSDSGQALQIIDASKSMRTLPAPISNGIAFVPSPLDRPLVQPSSKPPQHQHPDYRTNSSFAALLRAEEIARAADADDEDMNTLGYP